MATFKPYYGLKKIEFAPAVQNNTDPTELTPIPFTKVQTAVYGNEADSTTDVFVEEQTTPLAVLVTQKGASTFKWNTYVNDFQVLAALEGGTYTPASGSNGATYSPPDTPVVINLFLKFTNIQGGGVKFYNALVQVQRTGNFQKGALPELAITATAQIVAEGKAIVEFQPAS